MVYPIWRFRSKIPLLYWPFLVVALISFMVEDTLETQAGLTFFAFFNTVFLSRAYYGFGNDVQVGEETKMGET